MESSQSLPGGGLAPTCLESSPRLEALQTATQRRRVHEEKRGPGSGFREALHPRSVQVFFVPSILSLSSVEVLGPCRYAFRSAALLFLVPLPFAVAADRGSIFREVPKPQGTGDLVLNSPSQWLRLPNPLVPGSQSRPRSVSTATSYRTARRSPAGWRPPIGALRAGCRARPRPMCLTASSASASGEILSLRD